MDNEELKKVISKSGETDLPLLIGAKENAKRKVMDDPNKGNLDAFDKASKMLADALDADSKEPSFPNRIEALGWLQRQGYKIAKSKLYADCKHGLLKIQDDGSVFESDLKRYIRKVGLSQLSKIPDADINDLQTQKAGAEIEKLRAQVKLYEFQIREKLSKYILRSDFEMEFAARVAVLKSGLEHEIYFSSPDLIDIVINSDKETVKQKFINRRQRDFERQFNDFANIKKFQVVFAKEDLNTETTEADG